ncbi:MAG: S8 family serine peptidase [Bacteroidetes bacterium]|nr:S8 family serine peptidase [Bacteroidota bacterium]MCL2303374.1 S8 family serine peptidase [Lentimicrobiaceae bacterium]
MKKVLLLLVAITVCFTCFCQEISKIDIGLQEEMLLRNQEELIRVNIILKAQYDQLELRSKAENYRKKEDKRAFVVNELKNHSKETQQEVMSYLNHFAKNESVTDITSFWIFNGITCYATKEVIEALSYLDDVLIIGFDKEDKWIPEYDEPRSVEGSKELTYNVLKVNAHLVWDLGYTGEGIIVGVLDTGVNYNHHDLRDHMWTHPDFPYNGWNFNGNNNNPMDDHGHGTHCAGTVAGDGTSGSQTGMAPNAKIMALKVWNSSGSGTVSQMCAAFEFGVEHGAHILSMSGGRHGNSATDADWIQFRNTMNNVLEAGIIAPIAAGNEGPGGFSPVSPPRSVRIPSSCPPPWLHPDQTTTGGISAVISVGATDINDNIAGFSSRGPVTWQNIAGYNDYPYSPGMGLIRPDVVAPGVNIKSLHHINVTGYADGWDGTSMACPAVSGIIALMLEKNPKLTPAEICEILETTAVKLSATKNNIFGSGRVDALEAVNAVPVGPIAIYEVVVDDSEGNNNGNANPGETIKLDISLINESEFSVNDVTVTITSSNEYVTITNDFADFENFNAGEIKTLTAAFTFELSPSAPAKNRLTFRANIVTDDDEFARSFNILTFDYELNLDNTAIDDAEGNGNGMLDPGETADILAMVANLGNEPAKGLTGFLTSSSNEVTINSNTADFGDMEPDQSSFAPYNITLSESAVPGNINIPFNLLLTDEDGRKSSFNFVYRDRCNVIFNLHDSYGDGWTGNQLVVSFSDGSPTQNLTVPSGSFASFSIEINSGVTVSLSWVFGSWPEDCSFVIYYQGGEQIYSGVPPPPGSGVFFSWVVNCGGSAAVDCEPISDLSFEINDNIVELSWAAPANGTPNHYEIYNNFVSVGITSDTHFSTPLNIGGNDFCVYAIFDHCLVPECISVYLEDILPPTPPVNLTATPVSLSEIKLEWEYDDLSVSFILFRDDNMIVDNIVNTQYVDTDLDPHVKYCYVVKAFDGENKSDASNEACATILRIEEHSKNLKVYPNPSNSVVNIEGQGIEKISIINPIGQIVKVVPVTDSITSINISGFAAGNYIFSVVYFNNSAENIKVVINN